MPLAQHLEPGFKRAVSKSHQVHPLGTRTTVALKVTALSKAYWFKEYMSLTNTAGDKLEQRILLG